MISNTRTNLYNNTQKISLRNTFKEAVSWEGTYWAFHPLGSSWHRGWPSMGGGADWSGMAAAEECEEFPLVNTSCSDGHHTLISLCPSPPLIIIMVSYSLPTPRLLPPALPVAFACLGQVGFVFQLRILFTWSITWYLHADTTQWVNRQAVLILLYTVQWLSNVNNGKEVLLRALVVQAPSGPLSTLYR